MGVERENDPLAGTDIRDRRDFALFALGEHDGGVQRTPVGDGDCHVLATMPGEVGQIHGGIENCVAILLNAFEAQRQNLGVGVGLGRHVVVPRGGRHRPEAVVEVDVVGVLAYPDAEGLHDDEERLLSAHQRRAPEDLAVAEHGDHARRDCLGAGDALLDKLGLDCPGRRALTAARHVLLLTVADNHYFDRSVSALHGHSPLCLAHV